jgi:hypothetical protein
MVDRSRTVSSCPAGQVHGADESLIGRVSSKVSPQARQRYSYLGTARSYIFLAYRMTVPVPLQLTSFGFAVAAGAAWAAGSAASAVPTALSATAAANASRRVR